MSSIRYTRTKVGEEDEAPLPGNEHHDDGIEIEEMVSVSFGQWS